MLKTHITKNCRHYLKNRNLFSVKYTVLFIDTELSPPYYVLETLSLRPKNAVLDKFDPKDILVELDKFLNFCKSKVVSEETITDINVKTLNYIKSCKKMKTSRNILLTQKYLKENNLLAIPFDKGIGICVMGKKTYESKMNSIINLPQFEKVVKNRKNAKHPILKEEERVISILKNLKESGDISDELFQRMKPIGSQPARLYGLAKVH